eukprot:COSAG01_NODE_15726_length_1306_cov_1.097763_1_plen_177_part_00
MCASVAAARARVRGRPPCVRPAGPAAACCTALCTAACLHSLPCKDRGSMTSPLFAFRCSCYDIPNVSLLKATDRALASTFPQLGALGDEAVGSLPAFHRTCPPTARLHSPSRRLSTARTPRPPAPSPLPAALNPSSPVGLQWESTHPASGDECGWAIPTHPHSQVCPFSRLKKKVL